MSKEKDSIDAQAFVIMLLLTLITFSLFGYIFYKMGTTGFAPVSVKEDAGTEERGAMSEDGDAARSEARLDDSGVRIMSDTGARNFEIWNNTMKVGEIKEAAVSEVKVWRRIGNDLYFGVTEESRTRDEFFDGPQEVYKLELESGAFSKIFDRDAFASDISGDKSRLVAIERFYVGDKMYNYVNVYDLATYKAQTFEVLAACKTAGNAYFTGDGRKVAYEAAIDTGGKETFRMFVIDLETGKQEQVGGNDSYGKAKAWAEDNQR